MEAVEFASDVEEMCVWVVSRLRRNVQGAMMMLLAQRLTCPTVLVVAETEIPLKTQERCVRQDRLVQILQHDDETHEGQHEEVDLEHGLLTDPGLFLRGQRFGGVTCAVRVFAGIRLQFALMLYTIAADADLLRRRRCSAIRAHDGIPESLARGAGRWLDLYDGVRGSVMECVSEHICGCQGWG